MRAVIKIFVVLGLLAALIYGGLRGYAWYMVKKGMDNLIAEVSQYVEISYGSIYSSPKIDGTVGVDRIVIRPKMSGDEIKIQSVRISYPDIFQLIAAKKDMPNSMRASISGFSIDLDSPLMSFISQAQKNDKNTTSQNSGLSSMDMDALGCGPVESIGIDELIRMGYQTLDMDLNMDYSYEKIKNLLKVNAKLRLKGMTSADINLAMRVAPSDILFRRKIKPVIDYLKIDSSDAGYAQLRNRFCAAQLESSEDTYIDKHVELVSKKLGATFPSDSVEAYKKTMHGEGHTILEITPKPGTDLEDINQYPLRDIIDILGVKLTLDNQEVDLSKLEWGKNNAVVKTDENGEVQPGSSTDAQTQASHAPASYHSISGAQLSRYVGYQAHIKTRSGLLRNGVIESAERGSITIQMVSPGGAGVISFSIALNDISSAEVLY